MVKIWTARVDYKGEDRLDITIKKDINPAFTPTWKMVSGHKNKIISWEEYTRLYLEKMRVSYMHNRVEWNKILNMEEVTFVCFCKAKQCHRYLLADLFVNLGATYMGERKV